MKLLHYLPALIAAVEAMRLYCLGEASLLYLGMPDLAMITMATLLTVFEGIPNEIDDRILAMALEAAGSEKISEADKQQGLLNLQERKAKQRMAKAF